MPGFVIRLKGLAVNKALKKKKKLHSTKLKTVMKDQVFFFRFQGPPPQPGQLKFTVVETCERIKEEFNFLQAQYHT